MKKMETKGIICFDMDGTIADFYGVSNWLESIERHDATPYIKAAPMWDMPKLNKILKKLTKQGWEVRIISWLAYPTNKEYDKKVRNAKKAWLRKYKFPASATHIVQYGTTKANCVRRLNKPAILIDDNEKVCRGWSLGETVNPKKTDIIDYLETLII